jgi:ankyrin repeat protein
MNNRLGFSAVLIGVLVSCPVMSDALTCTVIQGHPCFANESATRIAITDSSDASVLGILLSGLATSAPPGLRVDLLESFGEKPDDYHKVRSIKTRAVFWVLGLSLRCDNLGKRQDSRPTTALKSEERLTPKEEYNREAWKVMEKLTEFCISKPVCIGFPSKEPPDIDMVHRMNETGVSFRIKKGTTLKRLRRDDGMVLVKDIQSGKTFWVGVVTLICDPREIEFWQRIYKAEEKRQDQRPGTEGRSEEMLAYLRKLTEEDRKRPRSEDEKRQESLIRAIEQGKLTEVEGLLKNRANVNAPGSCGRTPLYMACDSGRVDVVKLLLDKGADANASGALSSAACQGHVELVKLLLDKGADVNARSKEGWTPLLDHVANVSGKGISFEVVKLLLDKGADVNASDKDGETVLYKAVGPLHPPCPNVVKLLLDNGAKINSKDVDGSTPLMTAAAVLRRGDSLEVVKLLLDRGADVNASDNDGGTAFTETCGGRYPARFEALELLVSRGANINARKGNATCLDMARAGWADKELAKWLKAHGAR